MLLGFGLAVFSKVQCSEQVFIHAHLLWLPIDETRETEKKL